MMNRLKLMAFLLLFFVYESNCQENPDTTKVNKPGFTVYGELLGKGYFSINGDFRINDNHRISVGLTSLDYDIKSDTPGVSDSYTWLSPGVMYYYLPGTKKSRLELGFGVSISPFPWKEYTSPTHEDSPISLHGVIGYRYQKENGLLFRAGFTPFYRIRNWFLPLVGVSFGYSW